MRGSPSRAINRGSLTFTRPVFPSPTPPGWNQRRFGAPPELRTPPSPATHVRDGDRPSSTDLELPLNSHPSISNPVVHSIRATSRRTARRRCAVRRCTDPLFLRVHARHATLWLVSIRACVGPRRPIRPARRDRASSRNSHQRFHASATAPVTTDHPRTPTAPRSQSTPPGIPAYQSAHG